MKDTDNVKKEEVVEITSYEKDYCDNDNSVVDNVFRLMIKSVTLLVGSIAFSGFIAFLSPDGVAAAQGLFKSFATFVAAFFSTAFGG